MDTKNKDKQNIDLSFKENNDLLKAIVDVEIFGKPKCKTRRRRIYETKGINR